MIKITNTGVWGFDGAVRGMRNPYMSHGNSDSKICTQMPECYQCIKWKHCPFKDNSLDEYSIGEKDMRLACTLIKAGSEHRKFLRMIHVQADILAPRYWWAEMDTYKHVNMNSSSTMHLIAKRELTIDDFSTDGACDYDWRVSVVTALNSIIQSYKESNDKGTEDGIFRSLKQLLPESYNQLRTIDANYECLLNIYRQRKNHRLTEWHTFCKWVESLPYMKEFLNAMD